jgi:serine protease Do
MTLDRPFRSVVPLLVAALVPVLPVSAAPPPAQKAVPRQAAPAPQVQDELSRMEDAVDALTRKVWPSVVQIQVNSYGAQEATRGQASVVLGPQRSVGSGFVIDPEGYILTNAHVVSGALRIQVVLPAENADGTLASALTPKRRIVSAKLVGITTELDLAVLKVEGLNLPALPLATYSDVRQGEMVFAFGSPIGLRNSLTHGLVSAVARQIDPDSPLIYLQTDAPINPGNSGGPLVNIRGEVVGVNTFILSQSGGSDGLGFAIPCATARTAFKQLKQYGQLRRQEIGMGIQTITPAMAQALRLPRDSGVIVSDVFPDSPAAKAGLKVGDILVSVDDKPAENLPTVNYDFRLRDSPNDVKLLVQRGDAKFLLSVTPVEARSNFDSLSAMADPTTGLVPELGIIGVEIDARIAAGASGLRDPWGIIVVARAAGQGEEVTLEPRDIVRSVNGQPVTTVRALRDAMKAFKPGDPVVLQVQRDARLMYVTFTVD